jgi:hypothetical protein
MEKWRYSSTIVDLASGWMQSASRPGPLTAGEKDPVPIGEEAWWASQVGLDAVEKRKITYPFRVSNSGRPACSPSLYRLKQKYPCFEIT